MAVPRADSALLLTGKPERRAFRSNCSPIVIPAGKRESMPRSRPCGCPLARAGHGRREPAIAPDADPECVQGAPRRSDRHRARLSVGAGRPRSAARTAKAGRAGRRLLHIGEMGKFPPPSGGGSGLMGSSPDWIRGLSRPSTRFRAKRAPDCKRTPGFSLGLRPMEILGLRHTSRQSGSCSASCWTPKIPHVVAARDGPEASWPGLCRPPTCFRAENDGKRATRSKSVVY
jgi:hypothetical protein